MINWKNTSENLIISIIVFFAGGLVGYFASIASNKSTIKLLTPTIKEAILKETTKIENRYNTEIKKQKAKGGSKIDLQIIPEVENDINVNNRKKRKKGNM